MQTEAFHFWAAVKDPYHLVVCPGHVAETSYQAVRTVPPQVDAAPSLCRCSPVHASSLEGELLELTIPLAQAVAKSTATTQGAIHHVALLPVATHGQYLTRVGEM